MHLTEKDKAELIKKISGVETKKCMKCGKCSASCPSFDEMEFPPHLFVSMVTNGDVDRLLASSSIYKCLSCFACVERCPRTVEPANIVEAIRVMVLREADAKHYTPETVTEQFDAEMPQQAIVSAFRKFRK